MQRNEVNFKALTFISEQTASTFNYEVKGVRALWDPSLSIPGTNRRGGWRCPVGTRYGGQITDRFGRSCGWGVARRIANQIADIGERLENIDDRKRNNRIAKRNARMQRLLSRQQKPGFLERGARGVAEALDGGQPPQLPVADIDSVTPRPRRRRGKLRESEQRRMEREIVEPGAPRTDERAPRNIPARPQRRRPNANERRNVNLLAPESDEVLQGMRREMEADPDFDKENPEYQRVLAEIQRREQVAQGNRTNNRNNRRRASERQAGRTATRRPENNPPPAAEAQPQRPARRRRAQQASQIGGEAPEAQAPAPAVDVPNRQKISEVGTQLLAGRESYEALVQVSQNLDERRLSQFIDASFPTTEEVLLRDELKIYNRDRFRALQTTEFTRINDWVNNRNEDDLRSDASFASYEEGKLLDIRDKMNIAGDKMIEASILPDSRQRQGKIKLALKAFDEAKQQALELELMRKRRERLLNRPNTPPRIAAPAAPQAPQAPAAPQASQAPAAPTAPNTQAAFARTAPVSRLSASIQNAINVPDGPARRQDLEQKVNDLIADFVEVFPEAERTQVLQRLERAAVAAKQNAESDAQSRLSTVNGMSFASVNSTIPERKRERETALRAAMTELTALASNREADDARGRNANEQRLNRIIANLGNASNLEQRLENLEIRKEAVAVIEAERIAREQAEALRQAQLAGPVQPINFAQVRNMAPVFDNAVAKVTAGGNAQKVLDAIDEQEIEVRRAASKTQWNLMVKSIEDSLSTEHGVAIAKIQTLSVRDARKEREARLRGFSDPNGSLRTKEDAETLLASAKERLNTFLADRQIVALQVRERVYKNTELYKQLTQVGQLQLVVDNWDADSALIHRATSNSPGDEFINLNDPEVSQKRQAMGPIGDQIEAKISAQIEKRQDVLFNYLDEKFGSANEPYADMTPEKWAALSPTAKKTYLKEAYSISPIKGQNGRTYKSVADVSGSNPNYSISVTFYEIDSNGNNIAEVGESSRSIQLGANKVYQGRLFITKRGEIDKGAGIATLYNQHAFHFLQKIGVTKAEVGPADDGAFVWAKVGFKPNNPLNAGRFQSELDKYAKFGYSSLISSPEEYWRIKYLVEKRPPGTHQEFIFAVSQSRSLPGGSGPGSNRRENQIKNWFKQNAPGGPGSLSFAEQRIGSRRRGQAVAPTPRVTRTRRPRIPVNSNVTPRSLRAPTDGNIR